VTETSEEPIEAELVDVDRLPAPTKHVPSSAVHTERDHTLSDDTQQAIEDSIPHNTRRAYGRQWDTFTNWCETEGRVPLPATPKTLAQYVRHLTTTPSERTGRPPAPSSVEQAIAVIRVAHRTAGYRDQPETDAALRVLKGYKKARSESGARKRKAPAINLAKLRLLIADCDPETLAGLRDRAILILGFTMMARRSELSGLHLEDVKEDDEGDLTILIRSSKTDQEGDGAEVIVPRGVHNETDPVRVVRAYKEALAERGITTGRLLRAINQWGKITHDSMSGDAINEMVQRRAARVLPDDGLTYTAHGFRAGGAGEAYKNKAPLSAIRNQGRWSEGSPQVLEYIRVVDARKENPMRGIGL
jgi:integrase